MNYENEELIRKDFARVLGKYRFQPYDRESKDPANLGWAEIFAEVGRLVDTSNRLSSEYRLNSFEDRMNAVEKVVYKDRD